MAMTLTTDDINALKAIFATKDDLRKESQGIIDLINDFMDMTDERFGRLEQRTARIEKHLSRRRYFPQLKLTAES